MDSTWSLEWTWVPTDVQLLWLEKTWGLNGDDETILWMSWILEIQLKKIWILTDTVPVLLKLMPDSLIKNVLTLACCNGR